MNIEQHLYTSSPKGFATIAATAGITREEQRRLEKHSVYLLPTALLYQPQATPPVKYVCYAFTPERFVVGRAVYIGKDNLGRPGNYLFHNLIFSVPQTPRLRSFLTNPARLIRHFEEQGRFHSRVPATPLAPFDLAANEIKAPAYAARFRERDLIAHLLYYCSQHAALAHPLLLIGGESACLDFLAWLFDLLPYPVRPQMSFDTYSYGVNLGCRIIGLPEDAAFQQNVPCALKVHLSSGQHTADFEMHDISPQLAFSIELAAAGRVAELNTLYVLEDCAQHGDYAPLKAEFGSLAQDIKDALWASQKAGILKQIVVQNDAELVRLIQPHIALADLHTLAAAPDMLRQCVSSEDQRIQAIFVDWLCEAGEPSACVPFLFQFPRLWKLLLQKIQQHSAYLPMLLAALQTFCQHYSASLEMPLLETILPLLAAIKKDKPLAQGFGRAFEALPAPETQDLSVLRTFVRYELSGNSALLEQLLDSDLFGLPTPYRSHILQTTLRALAQTGQPEAIAAHIRRLFEKAKGEQADLLILITIIEELKFPYNVRKALREVFAEVLQHLPKDQAVAEIARRIEHFIDAPASLFEKFTRTFSRKPMLI